MDNIDKSIGGLFLNCNTAIVQQRVQSQTCLSYAERLHGRVVSKGTDRVIDSIRNIESEDFLYPPYNAATFFSSSLMALLMKSLMVVPVAATNAATRE